MARKCCLGAALEGLFMGFTTCEVNMFRRKYRLANVFAAMMVALLLMLLLLMMMMMMMMVMMMR
jgi:hypothetical protein